MIHHHPDSQSGAEGSIPAATAAEQCAAAQNIAVRDADMQYAGAQYSDAQCEGARRRTAHIERTTSESTISVDICLDGTGKADIDTGVPFYDHMLNALSKHSLIDISVHARGDVDVDVHHTVEDTAICLGQALREALGDKRGISRFGDATVPLDEALARAVVDVAGRPYVVHRGEPEGQEYHLIGGHFTGALTRHVFESFAYNAGICVHVELLYGRDPHHIVEAQFKALARALRAAVSKDERVVGVPSTKGAL